MSEAPLADISPTATGTPIELVLFDCDGTLVESEALMHDVRMRQFSALGISCTARELAIRYNGIRYPAIVADLSARHGIEIGPEVFEAIEVEFNTRCTSELRPVAGARDLLEAMPVPFCLVSNSPRPRLIHMLRSAGLLGYFGPRIVSALDAGAPKPQPDVFLLAAELMGVPPSACLVVEDSLFGLKAGRAAGMRVAVYLGATHQAEELVSPVLEARPDIVLETLPDLVSFLVRARESRLRTSSSADQARELQHSVRRG
jgi:HAD superfamily hydrolase (TIGR01509 family)